MYKVEIYNHEFKIKMSEAIFKTKNEADRFVNDNTTKRGNDFIWLKDLSVEFQKKY